MSLHLNIHNAYNLQDRGFLNLLHTKRRKHLHAINMKLNSRILIFCCVEQELVPRYDRGKYDKEYMNTKFVSTWLVSCINRPFTRNIHSWKTTKISHWPWGATKHSQWTSILSHKLTTRHKCMLMLYLLWVPSMRNRPRTIKHLSIGK